MILYRLMCWLCALVQVAARLEVAQTHAALDSPHPNALGEGAGGRRQGFLYGVGPPQSLLLRQLPSGPCLGRRCHGHACVFVHAVIPVALGVASAACLMYCP